MGHKEVVALFDFLLIRVTDESTVALSYNVNARNMKLFSFAISDDISLYTEARSIVFTDETFFFASVILVNDSRSLSAFIHNSIEVVRIIKYGKGGFFAETQIHFVIREFVVATPSFGLYSKVRRLLYL